LQVISVAPGREVALVVLTLQTGRTHQIRVHLSQERGTPILADALYGGVRGPAHVQAVARELGRQALHASVLGFTHPLTAEVMRFESALPTDMLRAQAALELG
jgi:23S rRNA pseudouridine1911/1915/1917 synthase